MHGDNPILPAKPCHVQTPGLAPCVTEQTHGEARACTAAGAGPGLPPQVTSGLEIARVLGIFDFLFYRLIAPFSHPNHFTQGKYP
jgi:hypothetical protein